MNKFDFDVDIDMANRDEFLRLVKHTPASIKKDKKIRIAREILKQISLNIN